MIASTLLRSLVPLVLAVVAGFFLVAAAIIGAIESSHFRAFLLGGVLLAPALAMLARQPEAPPRARVHRLNRETGAARVNRWL
jgi:hypothetical protein